VDVGVAERELAVAGVEEVVNRTSAEVGGLEQHERVQLWPNVRPLM
jgi:hypothetical protein